MKKVITISRQFGSGGRTIGRELAERLGLAFYDKELIEKIARESKLSEKFIREQGEYAPSKNLFSYAFLGRSQDGMSINDYLWSVQRKLILELAEKEPCVIVGRCADYLLRDCPEALHVFVHADEAFRAKRIVDVYGETAQNPKKRLSDKDKKRAANYKYYTDRIWGMATNYHITLDSGQLGLSKCVDILADLAK